MVFTPDEVLRFARWTSDFNPPHVDLEAARQTVFGQNVVHGILSVLRTMSDCPEMRKNPGSGLRSLEVDFLEAVLPGRPLELTHSGDETGFQLAVSPGGSSPQLLNLSGHFGSVELAAGDPSAWVDQCLKTAAPSSIRRAAPVERKLSEFVPGAEIGGLWYAADPPPEYLTPGCVGPLAARVLGLTSYLVGMEVPGLRSLFTRLRLEFAPEGPEGSGTESPLIWRLRVVRFERRVRILDLELVVATKSGRVVAAGSLRAYVRFSPVRCDLTELSSYVAVQREALAGQVALVTGGTRGLGAEISATLALAGCTVYASHRGDSPESRRFLADVEERGLAVHFLVGDAGDPEWSRGAVEQIMATHGRMDLLVLNACAPPRPLSLDVEQAAAVGSYVSSNLALAIHPLAAAVPALARTRGRVVTISSSYVAEAPAGWAHYIALKQAVEGLTRASVQDSEGLVGLIVRPPPLQTSWNDSPTKVLGAIPPAWVAAAVLERLTQASPPGTVLRLDEFPEPEISEIVPLDDAPADFQLVLAATFTADPILKSLRFWLRELNLRGQIVLAPYGQVLQQLLNPSSELTSTSRGLGIVLLRIEDWLRELPDSQAQASAVVGPYLERSVDELLKALATHRSQARAGTLLLICPAGASLPESQANAIEVAARRLVEGVSRIPGVGLIVAAAQHQHYAVPGDAIHDPIRDEIGHIPYQSGYFHLLGSLIVRHAQRRLAAPRKVVAVDCDNTLWGGVVGEVGPEGLRFEPQHQLLQETLQRLAKSGVLVCLCSKNEEFDVWSVFDRRPDFRLSRSSVVGAMINWLPKSQNLKALAARLNLGIDSFLFLDDNPVECAEVRAGAPEVLTLNFPSDPAAAIRLLHHTWELDTTTGTAEDQARTRMYQEEFQRQDLQAQTGSFREFIASLQLDVRIEAVGDAELTRASQLTLRTNQFNFLTRRRDEAQVRQLMDGGSHRVLTVHVTDRFGDYGLVGLLIAERQSNLLDVDTFLLSCRVLGRGVEHRMVASLGQMAIREGLGAVRLRVEFTRRNAPARAFLESIASLGDSFSDEQSMQVVVQAEQLTNLTWEPEEGAAEIPAEAGASVPAAVPGVVAEDVFRDRERQIVRTALELATVGELSEAIDGVSQGAVTESFVATADEVEALVVGAFARALRVTPETVQRVDQLEALGCGSFKIVEITVDLLGRFPDLPSTLLFEHRSVSEIVSQIVALQSQAGPQGESAPNLTGPPRALSQQLVAVVGYAVRCAGANSAEELWELLAHGRSAIEPVPNSRSAFLDELHDQRRHWAGLLDKIEQFDAAFFGISPREAESLDPQLRLFLQTAWEALEDAGMVGARFEPHTGVYAALMYGDYVFAANSTARETGSPYRCWEGFSVANRLSQVLGFSGPSFTVETACSSSGTALHLAARAVAAGECRAAVVGGVNLILDPQRFVQLGQLGILSASGECRPFGATADGTILGEGCGVVVLRPLDEALAAGDRIRGIILGSALSTGHGTVGFTAPNPVAQGQAAAQALAASAIDPRSVSYIETHGTGTQLGDPIEIRGLELGYGVGRDDSTGQSPRPVCAIGSIKPNVGHLEAGAGMLGLIKVLLQFQHRQLVPSLTSDAANPQIPFAKLPFRVQRELANWLPSRWTEHGTVVTAPRRAALNSFGVGGANAHIVLEEPPEQSEPVTRVGSPTTHLLVASAKTPAALGEHLRRLARQLTEKPDLHLADVAATLALDRRHMECRAAVTVTSPLDAAARLLALADQQPPAGGSLVVSPQKAGKLALLFTGQGSQSPRMGQGLYEQFTAFREAVDRCARLLEGELPRPLLEVLFADPGGPDANLIHETGYTQPALFVLEYALSELWRSWGVRPDLVLGHSVGEHVAMVVAEGMSLADGLRLIAARGRLMQQLPPGGGMLSVSATADQIVERLPEGGPDLCVAAINAPRQVVVSGPLDQLERLRARLVAGQVAAKPLQVSHAFHSCLMEPMLAAYRQVASQVEYRVPKIPFISCVLGREASTEVTNPEYWVAQVRSTVQFVKGVQELDKLGARRYLEAGPHPVLVTLGQQCLSSDDSRQWFGSLRRDAESSGMMLAALGGLFTNGVSIDWKALHAVSAQRHVSLPHYPFQTQSFWIPAGTPRRNVATQVTVTPVPTELGVYECEWIPLPPVPPGSTTQGDRPEILIVGDHSEFVEQALEALRQRGRTCRFLAAPAADASDLDWDRLCPPAPAFVEVLSVLGCAADFGAAATVLARLVRLVRAISRRGAVRLYLATRGGAALATASANGLDPAAGAVWGFGRTVALECPELWGGLLDLDPADSFPVSAAVLPELLSKASEEDQVAWRAGQVLVPRLTPRQLAPAGSSFHAAEDGVYLLTGGTGALGLHLAKWLVSRGARHLCLVSRRGVVNETVRHGIEQLEQQGAKVEIAVADVADPQAVRGLLSRLRTTRPVRGIIHAAGVDLVSPIVQTEFGQIAPVVDSKLTAAQILHTETADDQLSLFLLFSSVSATLGSPGRVIYGAANAGLDTLAHERRKLGLPALSVAWGPWSGGGMASADDLDAMKRFGQHPVQPDRALATLDQLLAVSATQATVVAIDWGTFLPLYQARRNRPLVAKLAKIPPATEVRAPSSSKSGPQPPWRERLQATRPDGRHEVLSGLLAAEAARILGLPGATALQADRTFFDQGMDSLLSTEFSRALTRQLGVQEPGLVFQHPRLDDLCKSLLQRLGDAQAAEAEPGGNLQTNRSPWVAEMAGIETGQQRDRLRELLRKSLAQVLGLSSPGDLDDSKPLFEQGLDSLLATQFAGQLRSNLGIHDPSLVFQYPRLDLLTDHLLDGLRISSDGLHSESGTASSEPALGKIDSSDQSIPAIRLYESGQWAPLREFLAREFPNRDPQLLPARWRWLYEQSAERLGVAHRVWLATLNGSVIGHHGLIPVTVQVGAQTVPSGWFVDTVVATEHRQLGIGPQLLLAGDRGVPLALSLGQTPQMRAIALNLGWQQVAPLQRSQLLLRPANVLEGRLPAGVRHLAGGLLGGLQTLRRWQAERRSSTSVRSDAELREVERFCSRHDQLWRQAAADLSCAVVRDASFLNWKWVDQPGQQFTRLELLSGGECLGVVVLMVRQPSSAYRYRRAFISDLVVSFRQPDVVRTLLSEAINASIRLGADAVECLHIDRRLTEHLAALGFQPRPPGRVLLVHVPEDCPPEVRQRWLDPDGWFITQADSDIDRPSAE